MPPKKRARFGANKNNSKRNKILSANQQAARNAESEEQRFQRLEADRIAHAVVIAEESEEDRNARLETKRIAQAVVRAEESEQDRNARLETDRIAHAVVRAEESEEDRNARLETKRIAQAVVRAEESEEDRNARLETDRIAHAVVRAEESDEERNARLEAHRTRYVSVRSTSLEVQGAAFVYNPVSAVAISERFVIGRMEHVCPHCNALKWIGETEGMCCCNGKVSLPVLQTPPEPLKSLMGNETDASKHFLQNIRLYNSAFQMTSFGSRSIDAERGFMPTFKVQGQVYHRIGAMLPLENQEHQFLQIYFVGDERKQAKHRCTTIPGTREDIILQLQSFLGKYNNYVQSFKTALDRMPTDDYRLVIRADRTPAGEHERRFNAPVVNEVAVVISGNEFNQRDIVLQKKDNRLQRVCETHRSYDALQYPLIFWQGEDGYHFEIKQVDPTTLVPSAKKVSAMNFYSYRLMVRENDFNISF